MELIWTTKNCEISSVSVSVKKLYELRSFTNTNRRNCLKCSFFDSMNRQTRVKNKQESGTSTVGQKSQNIIVTHPSTPLSFCRHSLKFLSPTLPKLMNWIRLSQPPLSSDPDTPKFGTCTLTAPFSRRKESLK